MSAKSNDERARASEGVTTASPDAESELDQKLSQLRSALSCGGRVEESRVAVKELEARWPDDPRVQYWARVLTPPRVLPTPETHRHTRPLDRERAWLRQHAREYPGCWLAVYEDELVAADPDLGAVLSEARRALGDEKVLLHYQPGESKPK